MHSLVYSSQLLDFERWEKAQYRLLLDLWNFLSSDSRRRRRRRHHDGVHCNAIEQMGHDRTRTTKAGTDGNAICAASGLQCTGSANTNRRVLSATAGTTSQDAGVGERRRHHLRRVGTAGRTIRIHFRIALPTYVCNAAFRNDKRRRRSRERDTSRISVQHGQIATANDGQLTTSGKSLGN